MIETLNKTPTYVTVLIILTDLVVAVALWLGITRSAKRLDLPDRTQRAIAFLAALLPALWLLLAPTLATILGSYLPPLRSGAPHIGMPFLILTPIAFGLLLLRLPLWRRLLEATPQHWLLGIQVYRVVGAVFFPASATCPTLCQEAIERREMPGAKPYPYSERSRVRLAPILLREQRVDAGCARGDRQVRSRDNRQSSTVFPESVAVPPDTHPGSQLGVGTARSRWLPDS